VLPLAVDLRGAHKSFGSVQAVRGVALAVGSGEVMAFLGPNGAGKTPAIDMILGLSRPDAGAAGVYGMAPRQAVRKGLVSAVMQTGGLLKDLTVAETAQYTARLFAVSRPIGEVLERAGTTKIADRRAGKCPGGEQQRLRFAMALIPDPRLLILDEPAQGMDVAGRRGFWTAIRDNAARGQTIIFRTRTRRWLHRPHRLNGAGALIRRTCH
jgi:ABC-2 type transport system ATP-binding protein